MFRYHQLLEQQLFFSNNGANKTKQEKIARKIERLGTKLNEYSKKNPDVFNQFVEKQVETSTFSKQELLANNFSKSTKKELSLLIGTVVTYLLPYLLLSSKLTEYPTSIFFKVYMPLVMIVVSVTVGVIIRNLVRNKQNSLEIGKEKAEKVVDAINGT
jgi:hypothetical protein